MNIPAVEIKNLYKSYGKIQALKGINLEVPEGSIYGLLGPNGSGKTTLIKALVGALQPTSGEIKVLGYEPIKEKWTLRKKIGYMPQSPALYDELSARDNISFFGKLQNVTDLEKKVEETLAFSELTERAGDAVRTFSGGMKKRVSLSCALIHEPQIIFLDEPTAAIDPHLKLQSWALFRKLANKGVTLFISTHLMDEAMFCDKVCILRAGEIIALNKPQKILELGKTKVTFTENDKIHTSIISSTPENLATELQKFGLNKNELINILEHPENKNLKNVRLVGLMGMATNTPDQSLIRKEFSLLKNLFEEIKRKYFPSSIDFKDLSMGMSSDYLIAIEEGATIVRIGSLLF